jgi:hypothetical protein
MTGAANGNGRDQASHQLVVVHVTDTINPTLAGRGDVSYQSPPLPREEAQTLARPLLGRGEEPPIGEQGWTCPIAGGRRTVTLRPGPSVADSLI